MYAVALAVLLLPLAGLGGSYLAETRRGSAGMIVFSSLLAFAAALVLLVVVVAGGRAVHSDTITFWSFQVSQTPFRAVADTSMAQTFVLGMGYAATPIAAVLALLVTLVTLLSEFQLLLQFRRDQRLGQLARLSCLLGWGALLVALAPELFQVLIGFEVCGLAAALLVGLAHGGQAGGAARPGYLVWRAGALSLLLSVGFIYVKFSGPVATAAAAATTAAAKHKIVLPTPDGLNLRALDQVWLAATRGLVSGVGGRSLTLAAVLILVAAACACGLIPGQGLARSLGSAPGAAAGLVLAVAGGVVGVALLLQTFPLLRLAPGVLPALVVLATLTTLVAAALALREQRLRSLAVWFALSQSAWAAAGIGLGSPAAALAVLVSAALATTALLGVVSSLGREQRVDRVDQLGAAWRLARPTVAVLLAALAASAGVLGLGTFFGHAAVLTAAFGAAGTGAPKVPQLVALLAAAGEVVAMLLLIAAAARVALVATRGEESADPREARQVRRQLAKGRSLVALWPSIAATVLALLSGLVSLPGIGVGLGGLLGVRGGASALPWQVAPLGIVLVVPLLAMGGMAVRRSQLHPQGAEEPAWVGWLDGTRIVVAADAVALGVPGRAVELVQRRALSPAGDQAAGLAAELSRMEPRAGPTWLRWGLASGTAMIAAVALTVGLLIWAATGSHPGVGLP